VEEEGPLVTELRDAQPRSRALRAGVIGAGFIGQVHARSARAAGARLAGIVASSPERSEQVSRELGAEAVFADAEELIASDEVDVVHVCAPNDLHASLTVAALAAGKHVVCEKPVAFTPSGAEELIGAAEAAGRVVTVPFAYRYYPIVREARARVRSGGIGAVRLVHGTYLQDWLLTPEDDNWRVDADRGGPSRAFADIGAHWCDLVEFVTGERIVALTARTMIAQPERPGAGGHSFSSGEDVGSSGARRVETEDVAVLLLEMEGGALGSLVVSQVSAGRKNRLWFEVSGAERGVSFDQENPETLWVGGRDENHAVPRAHATLSPEAAAYVTLPGGHPQGFETCFHAFVADTYAAIGGESPDGLPRLADGLRATRLTDAVLRSADSRDWAEVAA
jgi:predicted dehydrogenase